MANAQGSPRDLECIPVFYKRNAVYEVQKTIPGTIESVFAKGQVEFHNFFEVFEAKNQALLGASKGTKFKLSRFLKKPLFQSTIFSIRVARYLCKHLRTLVAAYDRGRRIEILNDDVIVMLDASWQQDSHELVGLAKSQGRIVVGVIYDLIPVTHPHLFNDKLVREFNQWLEWIIKTADGFMAISKAVRDQAENLMREKLSPREFEQHWFDYFYLGSELDLKQETAVREKVHSIFGGSLPVYLMVSTIEPRKNHEYLLDAFDELWDHNQNIILCFVGKVGWKCEALLKRIQTHPEINKRLFMLNDLNDTELEFAYQHSKALVFSSIAEGFGLPIVEAMQRELPVMASDIPVFREVGEEYCAYFKLEDPKSLAELVAKYELTGEFASTKPLSDYQWLSWKQATERFLDKIQMHVT